MEEYVEVFDYDAQEFRQCITAFIYLYQCQCDFFVTYIFSNLRCIISKIKSSEIAISSNLEGVNSKVFLTVIMVLYKLNKVLGPLLLK